MKAFLFVLSFILILFGISIWYYRASPDGFSLPKVSLFGNPKVTGKAEVTGPTEKFKSLEIVAGAPGSIAPGQKRVFFAVGKTETGGSISVNGNWYLSDSILGNLGSGEGAETTFQPNKEGKVKLILSYASLKTEKELNVSGAVLGAETTASPTPRPKADQPLAETVTPTPTQAPLRPIGVNIYDPSGSRLAVGDQRTYSAKVVFSDGSLKDLGVDWSLSGDLGTLSRSNGTSTDFKALKTGSGRLNAAYQGISSQLFLQVN